MPDTIPNLHQWERGPKITAIGGGTGLSTMLRGLKKYTKNLTAVVTVADDGGGSGVLRRDIGMPPPGDIRHCMESLANVELANNFIINFLLKIISLNFLLLIEFHNSVIKFFLILLISINCIFYFTIFDI